MCGKYANLQAMYQLNHSQDQNGDIGGMGMVFLASSVAMAVWGSSMWGGMGDICYHDLQTNLETIPPSCSSSDPLWCCLYSRFCSW